MTQDDKQIIKRAILGMDAAIELAEEKGDCELIYGFSYVKLKLIKLLLKNKILRENNETTGQLRYIAAAREAFG